MVEQMNYKITIDVNLMYAEPVVPAMETLKRWEKEGKVVLVEAEPPRGDRSPSYGWPGSPPKPQAPHRNGPRGRMKKEAGSLDFKGVAAVLFPQKDSQKLSMGEVNNVAHLIKHHSSKNEMFVTHNAKDFIESGRRERLKASFGVIAMTPEETVTMLSEMECWK